MPDINNEEAFTPIEIEGGVVEQETFQYKRFNQMGNMVSLDASPYEQWSSLSEGNPLRELLTGSGDMRERDEFVTRIKDVKEVDIEALFDSIGEQYNGGGANELYDKAYGEQDVDELIESIPSQHELNNEFVRDMGMKTTEDEFAEMIDEIPSYGDISDEFAKEMGLDDDALKNAIADVGKVPSDFGGEPSLGLDNGKVKYEQGMNDAQIRDLQKTVGTKVDGKWGFKSQLALDKYNAGETKGSRVFASGKYQVIPTTMAGAIRSGYVKATDLYNAETQEKVMDYLLEKKRPQISSFLKGEGSIDDAMLSLAKEWASMPNPKTGKSYYGKGNKAGTTVDVVKKTLEKAKASGDDSALRELIAKHESRGEYNAYNQGTRGNKIIRGKSKYDFGNMSIASILNADKNKQDR